MLGSVTKEYGFSIERLSIVLTGQLKDLRNFDWRSGDEGRMGFENSEKKGFLMKKKHFLLKESFMKKKAL